MPGGHGGLMSEVNAYVSMLPDVAGIEPHYWLPALCIGLVFFWFLTGDPSRSR